MAYIRDLGYLGKYLTITGKYSDIQISVTCIAANGKYADKIELESTVYLYLGSEASNYREGEIYKEDTIFTNEEQLTPEILKAKMIDILDGLIDIDTELDFTLKIFANYFYTEVYKYYFNR